MAMSAQSDLSTHHVENQPQFDTMPGLWDADPALRQHLSQACAEVAPARDFAAAIEGAEMRQAGRDANRHSPELVAFDRGGRRLDEVHFHPAYHRLMAAGAAAGYAAVAWEDRPGGHAAHAAMVYLLSQVEPGVCCPLTMSYAAVPLLRMSADLGPDWLPKVLSRTYDPAVAPVAEKRGATIGMAMTEKQGGSDLRSNATIAVPDGDAWRLTGHKWFCSAPMSDAFLTLARTEAGLTCFLVPRWLEGGRNGIRLMRLKDKLGNRANASAEIEYDRALAWAVGDDGAGIRTIIEMVHHTRLDTAMAPAGLMRAALVEAATWCAGRTAFQRRLIDQPLMRAVLADLALDWEGALALGLRVAEALDGSDEADRAFSRISVALAKFLSNKRCPGVVYEAMEALGGMGYVEDTNLPLLYREAPLNSIWEGSGNVICLDILRTMAKEPLAVERLDAELDAARGADHRYDAALDEMRGRWPGLPVEGEARWFAERAATLLTASVLIRRAPQPVAEGYVGARVTGTAGRIAGSVAGLDTDALIGRITGA